MEFKDRSNIFCDLLSKTDFPKLEGIDFARANNVSLMNCESIINCCSKYENFKTLSLGINLDIDQNISYDNCCRFITNLPTSDIKILHYKQKNFSDINILYTMHKFPKLERLSVSTRFSMPRIASTIPSKIVTEQVIISFFEFVSKVPKLDNSSITFNQHSKHNYRFLLVPLLKRSDMEELEVGYNGSEISALVDFRTDEHNRKIRVKTQVDAGVDNGFIFSCLKEHSCKIKFLSLKFIGMFLLPGDREQTLSIMSKDDLDYLINGFWLEYVLKYCSALKDLTIISPGDKIKMHDNTNDLEQNNSVERLTMQYFTFSQENSTVFPNISKRLPALNVLTFIDCDNGDEQEEDDDEFNKVVVIKIDLPYTSIQVFTWCCNLFSPDSKGAYYCKTTHSVFYLKITLVGSSEHFYNILNGNNIASLSESNYHEAIKKEHDEEVLVIEISCVTIAQLRLSLENYCDNTFDLNL